MIDGIFTEKEKHVLYGLVRYPLLSNATLAETMEMKGSTVAAIHRRLVKKGYLRTVRIPVFQRLGCEMLSFTYATFNSSIDAETRLEKSKRLRKEHPELVWALSDSTQGISLQIARNYTEMKENLERLGELYWKYGFLRDPHISHVDFPFRTSRILNFFDFAPFLAKVMEMEEKIHFTTFPRESTPLSLTEKERRLYYLLIKYPEKPDREVAKLASVSRHTVARARRRFEEEGLMRVRRIVNLKKIGFGIVVLTHWRLNPKKNEEEIGILMDENPPIFMVVERMDGVSITAHRNFEEYTRWIGKAMDIGRRYKLFLYRPISFVFSTTTMKKVAEHEYSSIVRKLLNIKNE